MPFKLEVPLDASQIEDFKPEQKVKIAVRDAKGVFTSEIVALDAHGQGLASLTFEESPGPLRVLVGPADAGDEELTGLQTLTLDVSALQWGRKRTLTLKPILIKPFYWRWWLRWCRTFTIHGRLVCADDSPVPGAEVCAYDVDGWFVWHSTQLLGCATTDETGAFTLKFRWCCGWWPWWWLRFRHWHLDPDLVRRVERVLVQNPGLEISARTQKPTLAVFSDLLDHRGLGLEDAFTKDVELLDRFRQPLLERLPHSLELERLRIWPWWPWQPWWDCNPDVIFKATQVCDGATRVIVDEGCLDARPDIPTSFDVTLKASAEACCIPAPCPNPPCPEGECLVVDRVCSSPIQNIGGNLDAVAAAPAGYLNPLPPVSGADYNRDRPFAGTVKVFKTGTMIGVDYYEIVDELENPLPPGAETPFSRGYWDTNLLAFGSVPFPVQTIDGHKVYESREHYQAASGLTWDQPGGDRWWTSGHRDLVVPLDSAAFTDGVHRFRAIAWDLDAAGHLTHRRPLPVCGSDDVNEWVLAFDNRVTDELGHPAAHHCGEGVHLCTSEPDTHFISVKINGQQVDPCGVIDAQTGELEIQFLVHDPDGHLAVYSLTAHYGLNQAENLLAHATSLTGAPGVQPGPTYGAALGQGAVAPKWYGGVMTVKVPVADAFPIPCCYLLRLTAHKRTVVSCNYDYPHYNQSEYTLGVGVCGPRIIEPPILNPRLPGLPEPPVITP
jgi:hypothetical protein